MSFSAYLMEHTTTWCCGAPPHATVEVLQSSPSLLSDLLLGYSDEASSGGGRNHPESTTGKARVEVNTRKLFVLYTGNPGMVQFYEAFVRSMHDKLGMDVLVMGLAGHSLTDHNNGRLFTLQEQIEVADQFMQALLDSSVRAQYSGRVFIAGHSIGGFIASHVLARHQDDIKLYFGLCPVVSHIMASPNGQGMFFWGVPVLQWVAALLGSLFALLPSALRRRVVMSHGSQLDTSLQEALITRMSRRVLMNVFYLSFDEYRCVIRPDRYLLRSLQDKMCMYYVPADGWAPPAFAEEIKALCPKLKAFVMESDESVAHAWCIKDNDTVIERAIAPFL